MTGRSCSFTMRLTPEGSRTARIFREFCFRTPAASQISKQVLTRLHFCVPYYIVNRYIG